MQTHSQQNMRFFQKFPLRPCGLALLGFCVAAFLIRYFFYSLFVTWDSVHYLQLSLKPVFGDTHSVVFGFILKNISLFSEAIGHPLFFREIIFYLHFVALFFVSWIPIHTFGDLLQGRLARSARRKVIFLSFIFWLCIFPALLIFVSALWTEMLYFQFIILFAYLIKRGFEDGSQWVPAILFVLLLPIAYHTRFQLSLIPIALCLTTAVWMIRKKQKMLNPFLWSAFAGIALLISNQILKANLPNLPGVSAMTVSNAAVSAQCALRCQANLFQIDCTTEAGRKKVEEASCSDILLGFTKIGAPVPGIDSVKDIFISLGPVLSLRWLITAPFFYLTDIHKNWGLEIGRFEFVLDDALAAYPEAAEYYRKFLQVDKAQAKPFFNSVADYLFRLHFRWRLFNWLCVLALMMCFYLIFTANRFVSVFFASFSIGTWLIFSYFNPHVPFRFLIQILVPAFLAAFYEWRAATPSDQRS